ncbi:hypothetical protein [Vulgatibacter sp.]|uniref:hypothetical protein n=1 Tax=Vulgatibacter sp. TaxID=1971226 RepID=UPI00356B0DDC
MAEVIDITLHRTAIDVMEELLDKRGLAFFLKRAGSLPFAIDDKRVAVAVELAARRSGRRPVPEARESSHRAVRRRLISLVAEAMVHVGF